VNGLASTSANNKTRRADSETRGNGASGAKSYRAAGYTGAPIENLFNFAPCREHAAGVSTVLSVIRAFERADNAPAESLRNRFQETVFSFPHGRRSPRKAGRDRIARQRVEPSPRLKEL
jgi:hypothetical protein